MDFEKELLELEAVVLGKAAGSFDEKVQSIRVALAMGAPGIRAMVAGLALPAGLEASLLAGFGTAFDLGTAAGLSSFDEDEQRPERPTRASSPNAAGGRITQAQAAERMHGTGSEQHRKALEGEAKRLGVRKETRDAVQGLRGELALSLAAAAKLYAAGASDAVATAPVLAAQTKLRRAVTAGVNAAGNEGVARIAIEAGLPVVWESERDACVHCLAYAGEVSTDGTFPTGLTFGKKPLKPAGKKLRAPLHPNCRCRLRVLRAQSYADALKRESVRSILRGFALPGESEKVRLEAAERLAAKSPAAPASVVSYAKRAARAGAFPGDRRIPRGASRVL